MAHRNVPKRGTSATTLTPPPLEAAAPADPSNPTDVLPPAGGTLPAPADLSGEALEAYTEMNDNLREKVLEIRDMMAREFTSLLESRYRLGSLIKDIRDSAEVYGPMSDMQMARFFGEQGATVYKEARRIRDRYPPERFQELMATVNPQNGARVHYKHLAILLRVEDDKQADKMLNHILAAGLSTKETADLVNKELRKLAAAQGPRVPGKPRSFLGVLHQIHGNNEGWYQKYTEDWERGQNLIDTFEALPEAKRTEELADEVDAAMGQAEANAESHAFLAQQLGKIKRQIEEAVGRRRKGNGAGSRSPEEEEDEQDDTGADEE